MSSIVVALCALVMVCSANQIPTPTLEGPPAPEERFLTPGLIQPYWGLTRPVYDQRFQFCQVNCASFLQQCGYICVQQPFGPGCTSCNVQQHQMCGTCVYYNSVYQPWAPVVPAQPAWGTAFTQG